MSVIHREQVRLSGGRISRRSFVRVASAGTLAAGTLDLGDMLSLNAADLRRENRAVILLWMAGGPSQFETFDPKPDHENGGDVEAISTSVPGINIAAGWEQTARIMDDIAIIRSMTNKEGSHPRASYQMHTGYVPSGSVKHPSLAAQIAREIAVPELDIPSVVSVGKTYGAGFLGVNYEPFVVDRPGQLPANVASAVERPRYRRRLGLLDQLENEFAERGAEEVVREHRGLYRKASDLVLSPHVNAFEIGEESAATRAAYGETDFGKGCLLARRLVEAGVTFVEVVSRGWDTHDNNTERVGALADQVDPAMATLITDLKQRGMLERTLVVWMGEFGRTPRINPRGGRDHFPRVFNMLMAGGGVRGGRVIGASTADGTAVKDRPVSVHDLFCSICHSVRVNPRSEVTSPLGRPMKIVDGGETVTELFS